MLNFKHGRLIISNIKIVGVIALKQYIFVICDYLPMPKVQFYKSLMKSFGIYWINIIETYLSKEFVSIVMYWNIFD